MKTGIELIAAERKRQIAKEKWTHKHDDDHADGELVRAAVTYADVAKAQALGINYLDLSESQIRALGAEWPWELEWFKPSHDAVRNLEKAGALIAAEIDRLLRLKNKTF